MVIVSKSIFFLRFHYFSAECKTVPHLFHFLLLDTKCITIVQKKTSKLYPTNSVPVRIIHIEQAVQYET